MIDTKELRRLAQEATSGEWYVVRGNHIYGRKKVTDGEEEWHPLIACTDDDEVNVNFEVNAAFIAAANPAAITELIDRLEAAENDAAPQKALAESALRVAEGWERKCGELRARIEAMENQEPVAWRTFDGEGGYDYRSYADNENYQLGWNARNPNHAGWVEPIYLAPGAKVGEPAHPAPSVPVGSIADYFVSISDHVARQEEPQAQAEIGDLLRMLVAAPEAKP